MKKPLIDKCPCCEVDVCVPELAVDYERRTVEAECEQVKQTTPYWTKYSEPVLNWKCLMCGCRWVHGQFEEKEV